MNKITILMGKSGSGKDYILKKLLMKNVGFENIISITTRPIRENEVDGVDYVFENDIVFQTLIDNDRLIEYRKYNTKWQGKDCIWYYGTLKQNFDLTTQRPIVILDVMGAEKFIEYYGRENCRIIFIDCEDEKRELRARNRGSFDRQEWNRRLEDDNRVFDIEYIKTLADEYLVLDNNTDSNVDMFILDILMNL